MTFPTKTDLEYWQAKRKPSFAADIDIEVPKIHKVVNSHANPSWRSTPELELLSLMNAVKSRIKGGNFVIRPSFGILPEFENISQFLWWYSRGRKARRVIALRWLRRLHGENFKEVIKNI